MKKDYNYRILKFLCNQNGNINIRPFINYLIANSTFSGSYFANKLRELKDEGKIWFDNVDCLQVKSSMFQPDIHPILARIEPEGVRDYNIKRELYKSANTRVVTTICTLLSVLISIVAIAISIIALKK